jgi:hypothetical protein
MMLDDLRNSAGSSFYEEDPLDTKPEKPERRQRGEGDFLGMTAPQRFIISLFLFLMVAILGVFILIVFQKVSLPI